MKIELTEENYEVYGISYNERYLTIELSNDYCTSNLLLRLDANEALSLCRSLSDKLSLMADLKVDIAMKKLKDQDCEI